MTHLLTRLVTRLIARPQWQPIKTAPKSGHMVLLGNEMSKSVGAGFWSDGKWELGKRSFGPTHWMPLPEPPPTASNEVAA